MRRLIGTGFAALAVALALAGCAKDGGKGNEVATANKGTPEGATPTASVDPQEQMIKFAQCMRANGIQMEDPKPGEGIRIGVKEGQEETMKKAQEACRKYSPEANGAKPDPEMQEKARKFAKCMRDNGVKDFPDPDPNKPGILMNKKQGDDPNFKKAQEKCQDIIGAPTKTGKGGPGGSAQ
jgi:hypothetical protein